MKTKILLFFAIAAMIAGCKNSQAPKAAPTAPPVDLTYEYPMLDSASILVSDSVERWHPSGDAIVYARKVYLNAVDLWANKKDVKGSLPLFVRALRIAPEPVIYLHYAEALLQDTQYAQAAAAASFVYQDSTLSADAAMVSARSGIHLGYTEYYDDLAFALSSGKFDVREVLDYPDFQVVRDREDFRILLTKYDFTNEQRRHALMGIFRKNFPKYDLPYAIGSDSLRSRSLSQIDFLFDDIIPELGGLTAKFSRMTEQTYQYVAMLPDRPGFYTFVYRSVNEIPTTQEEALLPPMSYYLMTVDTLGKSIDKIDFACSCTPLTIATATIDTTGLIAVQSIRQTYKYNPTDSGYENNEVIKQEPKEIKYYRINSQGKIEPQDKAATAMNETPHAPKVLQWTSKGWSESKN